MDARMEVGHFDDSDRDCSFMETFGDSFDELFPDDFHDDHVQRALLMDLKRAFQSENDLMFLQTNDKPAQEGTSATQAETILNKAKLSIPISPSMIFIQTSVSSTSSTPSRMNKIGSSSKFRTLKAIGENVATYIPQHCSPRKMQQNNSELGLNQSMVAGLAASADIDSNMDEVALCKSSSLHQNLGTLGRNSIGFPVPVPVPISVAPSRAGTVRNAASMELSDTRSPHVVCNLAATEILNSSYSSSYKVVKLDTTEVTRGYFAPKRKSYASNLCTIVEDEAIEDSDLEV